MIVSKRGKDYYANLNDGPAVSGHKPSVDVMFESVAKIAGNKAIGVILTGMGRDGASGLLKMKEAGALTFGQDTKTCVVYGMPKVAFEIGAVQKQLPLDEISANILAAFKTQVKKVS
jgi:two-component system chemotaxis response regulator CheB